MNRLVLATMTAALALGGCATVERRQAVEQGRYLLSVEVENAAISGDLDAEVGGRGGGALKGAGQGFVACIGGGVMVDVESGFATYGLGTVIGTAISPVCAAIGALIRGVEARPRDEIEEQLRAVNGYATELDLPRRLPDLVSNDVRATGVYQILPEKDSPEEQVLESDLPPPSRATVRIEIVDWGLASMQPERANPDLELQVVADLCVQDSETHLPIYHGRIRVGVGRGSLAEWADIGTEQFETRNERLVRELSDSVIAHMASQVRSRKRYRCS